MIDLPNGANGTDEQLEVLRQDVEGLSDRAAEVTMHWRCNDSQGFLSRNTLGEGKGEGPI